MIGGIVIEDIHNHTKYSDGIDTAEDIIKNAIKCGVNTVGISDHSRALLLSYPNYLNFDLYVNEVESLKEEYKEKINILTGIELNLNFESAGEEDSIPFYKFNDLDYVLFEHVDGTAPYKPITEYCVRLKDLGRIRQKIRTEAGLAHTSLLELSEIYSNGKGIEYGMDCVIGMLKEYDLFWEINVERDHKYFDYMQENWNSHEVVTLFKKIKKNGVKIHPGSDTHDTRWYEIERVKVANSIAVYEF